MAGGERICVEGDAQGVEGTILAAARGSIMELAWFIEEASGERVGINPDHVLTLRPRLDTG